MAKRILIRPDGQRVEVPLENFKAATEAGYRPETQTDINKRSDAEEPGTAAMAGALRGVSMGLSDPLIVGASKLISEATGIEPQRDPAEQLKGWKEANPTASTAAEVGGNIAGVLTGPVKGAMIVGSGAKALVGGGLKGAVAAGAAEGTLFGLGTTISEASLGDPRTNAEKLTGVVASGLFGGAISTGGYGLGKLGKLGTDALTKAFGGKTMQDALESVANAGLEAQLGSRVKNVRNARNLYGQNMDDVLDYARKNNLVTSGDTDKSFLEKVVAHREEVGAGTGKILEEASRYGDAFNVKALREKVEKDLFPKLNKDPLNESSMNKIEKYLEKLESLGPEGHDLQSAWNLQTTIRESIGHAEPDGLLKKNMSKFRELLREQVKEQANAVSPHYGAQMEDLSNKYRMSKSLEDLAEAQSKKQQSNGVLSMGDQVLGGVGALASGGLGGAALAVGSKLLRERGGFMLAGAADKLAKSKVLERMAKGLESTIAGLSESGMLGAYRPVLEAAAARGSMNLLATHVQLAQSDSKYLPTLGMEREEGQASNQYAGKAERLESLAKHLEDHDSEVDASMSRFLKKRAGVVYSGGTPTKATMEDFDKRLTRITQVLQDPTLVDTSSLASTAPGLAMELAVQAQNAAGFLLSKAPKNPNVGLPAFKSPWSVSKSELGKFYRYIDAVERPGDLLKDLAANGTVSKEAVETMQVLYPQMLQDMKDKIMNRLLEWKEPLSYNQKRGLGSIFGEGFINENPQQLALLQAVHAGSVTQTKQDGPKKDGRQNQSQEDNLSTQAQRIEAR